MTDNTLNQNIDPQERGLHYGDGLFETLLMKNGDIPYWRQHYQRLNNGCGRLGIMPPDEAWLSAQVAQAAGERDTAVIKIIVTRGIGGRGLQLPQVDRPSVFVFAYPYADKPATRKALEVIICDTRLPINPNLAGIKHLNRLDYVLATQELHHAAQFDEGILCDTEGYLVEAITCNLFFVVNNEIYTPALTLSGVDDVLCPNNEDTATSNSFYTMIDGQFDLVFDNSDYVAYVYTGKADPLVIKLIGDDRLWLMSKKTTRLFSNYAEAAAGVETASEMCIDIEYLKLVKNSHTRYKGAMGGLRDSIKKWLICSIELKRHIDGPLRK